MDRVMRAFAAQFQPDGDGFVFREDRVGPGYRVTALERDAVMEEYDRLRSRNTIAIMVPAISLLLGICYNLQFPAHAVDLVPYFVLGTPVLVIGGTWATFSARAKALNMVRDRHPALPALTAEQRAALTTPGERLALIGILGVLGISIGSEVLFGRHGLFGHTIWAAIVPFAGLVLVAVMVSRIEQNGKTRS